MTPAYAVLALLAVLLVVFPAAAGAIWLTGSYLFDRRPGVRSFVDAELGAEDIRSLAELEVTGFASNGDIAALSVHERRFLARNTANRLSGHELRPTARARSAPPRGRVADREVPVAAFHLVCPACGASLGTAADVAHYVGSCPACSRRVASRRRGSRIALSTVDSVSSRGRPATE